jgi:hypothetical protein
MPPSAWNLDDGGQRPARRSGSPSPTKSAVGNGAGDAEHHGVGRTGVGAGGDGRWRSRARPPGAPTVSGGLSPSGCRPAGARAATPTAQRVGRARRSSRRRPRNQAPSTLVGIRAPSPTAATTLGLTGTDTAWGPPPLPRRTVTDQQPDDGNAAGLSHTAGQRQATVSWHHLGGERACSGSRRHKRRKRLHAQRGAQVRRHARRRAARGPCRSRGIPRTVPNGTADRSPRACGPRPRNNGNHVQLRDRCQNGATSLAASFQPQATRRGANRERRQRRRRDGPPAAAAPHTRTG